MVDPTFLSLLSKFQNMAANAAVVKQLPRPEITRKTFLKNESVVNEVTIYYFTCPAYLQQPSEKLLTRTNTTLEISVELKMSKRKAETANMPLK